MYILFIDLKQNSENKSLYSLANLLTCFFSDVFLIIILYTLQDFVSLHIKTFVPDPWERRRHVGGPTNWDLAVSRPIYFECKLNEPMHIGMQLLHPAATDHSVSIGSRQVQCIFRFSLRSQDPAAQRLYRSRGPHRAPIGRSVTVAMALPSQ